ncbi:hypothetical protein BDF21DRAFT_96138 [Thamnidium elegans]|nr:hypothetical protein BDF21DRAFT_96138 [Thamnidium elegans]
MDIFDNSQPLRGLDPLVKISSDQEQSDSEDEHGLSSLADYDTYANMNISENLKNILRMDSYDVSATQDDTESDNDSIYKAPNVNIEEINSTLTSKNKFTNFPLMPSEEKTPKKKLTKPREKKKKRDKGKAINILEQARQQKAKNLNNVLKKFADENSDDEEEEEEEKPVNKKKGRKTRKQKDDEIKVDENGEPLVRTTEFLNSDTDDSIDDNRALSKKEELEMHRNSERARRANQVKLTPVYNVKSFEDFVKRRDERETMSLSQLEVSSRLKQSQPIQVPLDDSSDDDLVIMNDPSKLLSPDRPIHLLSPARQSTIAFRNHNKSLLSRITNEGYMHRIKMEEAAKARGQFTSATERAKKLLEKEKNALLIDAQIKMHFDRNKNNNNLDDEDNEEEDQDYKDEEEEEEVEDDYLNQLSGQDEDDEVDTEALNKRKINDDEDSEENTDMGIMAMKRWKNKKIKKSIFEDSDDEEEEQAVSKKKPAPVPVHSISNFFKAKETKVEEEHVEDKPLGRLKRRVIQPDAEEEEEDEDVDDDAMDIDEPVTIHRTYTTKSIPDPKEKNEYFEEEAEEEEDEYYGAGGEDLDNGEDLDEFEDDDLLVHENNEHIDEADLRDAFNKQDAESDHNMIQRLLKDVTGGGLRKQKAAAEAELQRLEDASC